MPKAFIYAETAFHHEGDINYLMKLIDRAVEAGVDGIKFQVLININELISAYNPAFEKLHTYVFTIETWKKVFQYAIDCGLALIIMPLDLASFNLLDDFGSKLTYLELHSVSFNDMEIRERIKKTNIDLILGVGGRTKEEIQLAVVEFEHQVKILMSGFQSFPSRIGDIRLRRISDLKRDFPGLEIGFADHSSFDDPWAIESSGVAYSLGATVIEKHLTLDEGEKRVDYESAVNVEKLKKIKHNLDTLFSILFAYEDSYAMTQAEIVYRNRQKMVVANRLLHEGEILKKEDLALKMIGRFDGFSKLADLIGKKLKKSIPSDFLVRSEDVNH